MLHFKRNAYVCVIKMISTTSNQVVLLGKLSPTAALTPTGRQLKNQRQHCPAHTGGKAKGITACRNRIFTPKKLREFWSNGLAQKAVV